METFLYIPLRYKSSMTSKTLSKGTLSRAMNKLINAFSTTENIIKYGGFFLQNTRIDVAFTRLVFLKLKVQRRPGILLILVVWFKVLKIYIFKITLLPLIFFKMCSY